MTLTVVTSSPRPQGNSTILAERVVDLARSLGASVARFPVARMQVGPCVACEACQGHPDDRCVYDDDAIVVLDSMRDSDAVLFAGPIYNFGAAAQLKLILDRMYSLGGNGRWDAMRGKALAVILTFGDSNPKSSGVENAAGMFRDMARFHGMTLVDILEVSADLEGEVLDNAGALTAADDLGRKLAGFA